MFSLKSDSPEKTLELGKFIGKKLPPGSIVLLSGNLGAGKTLLIAGILAGLGVKRTVKSPTFNLVHTYSLESFNINHFDIYRIAPEEFFDLGFEEYFTDTDINLLEWGEKIEQSLKEEYLKISIKNLSLHEREIKIESSGSKYLALMEALKKWS